MPPRHVELPVSGHRLHVFVCGSSQSLDALEREDANIPSRSSFGHPASGRCHRFVVEVLLRAGVGVEGEAKGRFSSLSDSRLSLSYGSRLSSLSERRLSVSDAEGEEARLDAREDEEYRELEEAEERGLPQVEAEEPLRRRDKAKVER